MYEVVYRYPSIYSAHSIRCLQFTVFEYCDIFSDYQETRQNLDSFERTFTFLILLEEI
jgi:hypothetical protein